MKYITPTLETERLILKHGKLEDYQKVYEYDFRKLRNINGECKLIKQDIQEIIGFDTYADEEDNVFDWIIFLKESNTPIANITADREDKSIKSTEIAFNMHPDYWRRGYMSEAIIRVLEFLFQNGFENVICGYSEGNNNSENIGRKIGFELFATIPNAWQTEGISITEYKTILSKEKFNELYQKRKGQII